MRGSGGECAEEVLSRVTPETRYAFDQRCRVAAIQGAVAAGILDTDARLSINFLPNGVYSPAACIQLTLKTARASRFPVERLIFEFTENEEMTDTDHVKNIVETYRQMGFGTAIDDFGAGHAGLGLLAKFQTDYIKLDMELVRGIDASMPPADDRRGNDPHRRISQDHDHRRRRGNRRGVSGARGDRGALHSRLSAGAARLQISSGSGADRDERFAAVA